MPTVKAAFDPIRPLSPVSPTIFRGPLGAMQPTFKMLNAWLLGIGLLASKDACPVIAPVDHMIHPGFTFHAQRAGGHNHHHKS
ncbi:MAG: hypothetical protein R3F03_08280 [Opitutaceae bacterium]